MLINYISLSGALNAIGDKNSNPSIPLNLIGDYGGGGMMLAMGILAGVISSSKTGKGQVIDAAMIDGSLSLMSFFYSLKAMGIWKDKRKSNLLDGAAHFYDTYECSDNKYIAVGSIESQFYKIVLDKLELTDPRFKNQMNQSMWEELKEIIATKIKSQSRDHWVEIFSDTDGCVTPVLNMDEAQEHKHNILRESFVNLEGFNQPAPAPRFSNDTLSIKHNAKEIGSDNVYFRDSIALSESYESFYKYLDEISKKIEYFVIESATPSWDHDYKLIKEIKKKYPKLKIVVTGPIAAASHKWDENIVHAVLKGEYE